jgi:hypothetical protein
MNPTRQPTSGPAPRQPLWRTGLASLCCFLAFLTSGSPALLFPTLPAQALFADLGETEERAPVEEEVDGKSLDEENREFARGQYERSGRRHALPCTRTNAWLAHLPHHHSGNPGYSLPACTPFANGSSCPQLRC